MSRSLSLPLPRHYDSTKVEEIYHERASLVAEVALDYRLRHDIDPAAKDRFRVAAFGIDCQIGFCTPGASLFVPGAVEDMQRTLGWLYGNLSQISALHFSMDTHRVFQIFHPAWWSDAEGKHPEPFTPITHQDVREGRWKLVSQSGKKPVWELYDLTADRTELVDLAKDLPDRVERMAAMWQSWFDSCTDPRRN